MSDIEAKIAEMTYGALVSVQERMQLENSMPSESPIERLLRAAFIAQSVAPPTWLKVEMYDTCLGCKFESIKASSPHLYHDWHVRIFSQVSIGPYRLDFLAACSKKDLFLQEEDRFYLAIECDGHDFHERTKEQAAHDKSRDRYLLSRQVPVMRFTGSEIWSDSMACASEAIAYFEDKAMPELKVA